MTDMGQPLRDESEQAFMIQGECQEVPPHIFNETADRIEEARAICGACAVRKECLNYALNNPARTKGWIYSGLTTAERAAISNN